MLWAATMVAAAEMRAAEYFMVAVVVVWGVGEERSTD
jgi:hypothetical protein